jgi:hypothetical protein
MNKKEAVDFPPPLFVLDTVKQAFFSPTNLSGCLRSPRSML